MSRGEYDDRDDRDRGRDDRDRDDERDYRDEGPDLIATARRKVKPVAICLIIVGVISLGFVAWGSYQMIFTFDRDFEVEKEKALSDPKYTDAQKQEMGKMMDMVRDIMRVVLPASLVVQAVTALVMIFGSFRMMPLASRGWGLGAAAAAFVPHMSCLVWAVSLAFGIWALVVLNNKVVKRGFEAKQQVRAGGGYDDFDRRDERDDRDRDDRR